MTDQRKTVDKFFSEKLIIEDIESLCMKVCNVVGKTAAFINENFGKVEKGEIEEKNSTSLVSFVDRTAEMLLVEGLKKLLPGASFLTEENTIEAEQADYVWVIDPLDGTTNFLRQLPFFAISVALQYKEQTIIGVVYEVVRKECFYAWKNGGAFLNGTKIRVSEVNQFKNALIATGLPDEDDARLKKYLTAFKYFQQHTMGIRRYGAAAIDMAYVACGRFDGYFQYGLYHWDVAAGALLVQEAGGVVTDFTGDDKYMLRKEMVASNQLLAFKFLGIVQAVFY